ncbi:c-type cytochrome [Amaricoccus sp. W119]|uniref:cytochrome c n=1 Tax=Amaricoccus sp. W119 TaxID=3391833 RepID=UPI0039A46D50
MRREIVKLAVLALVGLAVFYVLTMPRGLSDDEIAGLPEGDATRGEAVFWAGGCSSCHAAADAEGEDRLLLGGGRVLKTDFGDFTVPNISNDAEDGIGAWSTGDLANAMMRGVSPDGRHYYPSFPYTSYARMKPGDIADLRAYLATLPAVAGRQAGHALGFPFNIRRGLGLWQWAFLSPDPVLDLPDAEPAVARGQYLVEGPGHCGECHTPRGFAGDTDYARWLGGAPAAEGDGNVPNITPGDDLGDWSAGDIAYYLESGFTPDYDSVGGAMVEVQENMAMLPAEDREAIAAYLGVVPAVGN